MSRSCRGRLTTARDLVCAKFAALTTGPYFAISHRPLPTPLSLGNHFPSASVYQERRLKKGAAGFFSVAKEKGGYLDQPRIRRICVIASLLDVITSRYEAKFVDQPFPLWNYSSEICAANAEKRKRLVAGRFCHPSPSKKGRQLAGSRFLRRTRPVRRPNVSRASHWPRTPRPSPFCIRSR